MKLFNLLLWLTKADYKYLDAYMTADYWYKRPETVRLYQFLRQTDTDYSVLINDKPTVFAAIFPDAPFDKTVYSRTISALTKAIENGLEQAVFEQNKAALYPQMVQFYYKNNAAEALNTFINDWNAAQPENAPFSMLQYQEKLDIERAKLLATPSNALKSDTHEPLNTAFDTVLIIEKLRLYAANLTNSFVFKHDTNDPIADFLLAHTPTTVQFNLPIVRIYYNIIVFTKGDTAVFDDLLLLLYQNKQILEANETQNVYRLLENACAIQYNSGKKAFLNCLFDLYKQELALGLLYNTNGLLSTDVFLNIVKVANMLKAYNWAKNFLHEYKDKLPNTEREDVFQYNLATLHFETQDYTKTLDLLNKIEYHALNYKIWSRILRIKTYYTLAQQHENYYNSLESDLAAYLIFVYRITELNTQQKNRYKNFAYYLQKILKLLPRDTAARTKLHAKLTHSDTAEKTWLLNLYGYIG